MTELTNFDANEEVYRPAYHHHIDKDEAQMKMMGLIDRMEKWNNQKKAKMAEAKKRMDQERVDAENATFKPKVNRKKKRDELFHFEVGQGSTGLQKYLLR